jgi:hypothetical protein
MKESDSMDSKRTENGAGAGDYSPAAMRTAMFLAAGLGLLLVGGWLQVRPTLRSRDVSIETAVGKPLFPELADASKAASLEIVSFDEDTATLAPFKVVKSGGVWVLPAHQNYPADAKDQLAAAATELVDRPILEVVSTSPGDHELYGVKEPDADKVAVGETGVGQLVEIRDASGNKLARLIVGKEFKRPVGVDAAGRTIRFVRRAGQDPVYRVELDTSKFTTKFDDWIEKDLLKLSPWDVTRLSIDDSTAAFEFDPGRGPSVSRDRNSLIELAYDDKDAAWSMVKLTDFAQGNKPESAELTADEQLASAKLNELRQALGDLKIVDVARKPAGLSAELKADKKFTGNEEAVLSLAQRGFFPIQSGEVLSSSGETVVGMKDGVEYLLRFGNAVAVTGDGEAEAEKATETPSGTGGRYLFVLARFNENLLAKPELKPLPDLPDETAEKPKPPEKPEGKDDATKDDEPGDDKAAAEKGEPGDGEKQGDEAEAADALAKADEEEAQAQAAIEGRRLVERENRLAQEAYDEKVKTAQKRVQELNNRFADWYYVVSDSEYAKIRLGRADVIEAKPAEEAPEAPADPAAP